jgi:hypothetical protein
MTESSTCSCTSSPYLLNEIIHKLYDLRHADMYTQPQQQDAWDHGVSSAISVIEPYLLEEQHP